MKKRTYAAWMLIALAAVGVGAPASGAVLDRNPFTVAREAGGISADQAAAIVRAAYGGRVVSVKPAGNGWSVRVILDGGRVKNVRVDANGSIRSAD